MHSYSAVAQLNTQIPCSPVHPKPSVFRCLSNSSITHNDLGQETLLLGQKLIELATILEFGFCVTRKLPNPLHDFFTLWSLGPRLYLSFPL
jgi:hypothetical protein